MGTKHGYTEKECKVCHETKQREEFPAFGGLTCRECIKVQDREKQHDRYEHDKQDPKYVERKRRNAREYKRRKKLERDEKLSIEQAAAELRQAGAQAANEIAGVIAEINGDLDRVSAKLQQARTIAEDSTNVAAQVLGDTHSGTTAIIGAAAEVVAKVEEVQGLVSQFSMQKDDVSERGGALSQVFESVANGLMQGPS